jgi:putative transposase
MDIPILKGYKIFHNWIRTHQALEGMAPAEKCGIEIEEENKWLALALLHDSYDL